MVPNRRKFLKSAAAGTLGSSIFAAGCGRPGPGQEAAAAGNADYSVLDTVLSKPILNRDLFPDPVIIESMELLYHEGNFLCRVRSAGGAAGISVGHNQKMPSVYPMFLRRIQPFFTGRDARDLDRLLEEVYVYESNYKFQGLGLWIPLATAEFAILDLLGQVSGKPLGELIGTVRHARVNVYQANNFRGKSPEESIQGIRRQVEETGAQALKFKVGGRMSREERPPGRSEDLIPLVRKTFGDDMVIYADSNGSYDTEEAIRIGRIMEEYDLDFYEEPVPFDWYEETAVVAGALHIPIAGGEQEPSMHNFRWLIGNDALQVLQPDLFYFGGMIRSMKVARMAEAAGKTCVPHISGTGLGYLYMLHFVSALSNAGPYHEFKGFNRDLPMECPTAPLESVGGSVKVPTGPGLGVIIDPDYIDKHRVLEPLA